MVISNTDLSAITLVRTNTFQILAVFFGFETFFYCDQTFFYSVTELALLIFSVR